MCRTCLLSWFRAVWRLAVSIAGPLACCLQVSRSYSVLLLYTGFAYVLVRSLCREMSEVLAVPQSKESRMYVMTRVCGVLGLCTLRASTLSLDL